MRMIRVFFIESKPNRSVLTVYSVHLRLFKRKNYGRLAWSVFCLILARGLQIFSDRHLLDLFQSHLFSSHGEYLAVNILVSKYPCDGLGGDCEQQQSDVIPVLFNVGLDIFYACKNGGLFLVINQDNISFYSHRSIFFNWAPLEVLSFSHCP